MNQLLEARDVTVRFGGLLALDGVSIGVPEASLVGLMGPNGAGKTTLFGVLSGLLRPRAGHVFMDGVEVTGWSPQNRAGRGLARTFQRLELFGELTVREHLVVAYRVHNRRRGVALDLLGMGGRPGPGEDERVDQLLHLLGLQTLASVPASALPLGTGRLVEVGRAAATGARVLLLDEPSSGLDSAETEQLGGVFRRLREVEGVSLLLVEHNIDFVLGLADRVTVLDFGRVIAEGAPDEVRGDPQVQAAYLGATT
jgi:ABC-type branched-subunit amino acid transport system ATPase component